MDRRIEGGDLLEDLLGDLPRGRRADHVGAPSNAYFEHPRDILATESLRFDAEHNRESKSFLGVLGGAIVEGPRLADGRPNRWVEGGRPIGVGDDRHKIIFGGSRGGKGRAALIPEVLTLPAKTSLLCIDPKGDAARITARWRESLRQQVIVLDPFGCSGPGTLRFRGAYDPIKSLVNSPQATFVPNARLIADALIVTGDLQERHWDETAKQILAGLCGHVATHMRYAGARNLITVWLLASELATPDPHDPHKYWLQEEMTASDAAGGMVRAAARQFYDRTGGEFSSVLSNLRKHLDFLSYECMQEVLAGENAVDLRDLKRSHMSLYVSLPAMRLDGLRGWLRLIVQMTLAACEEERHHAGNPCVLQLDEFFALGRLSALELAIAQIAGFGAKLHVALQDLGQLSIYEKNHETFVANAGTIQVLGCSDETTLEYLSKRLGQALVLSRSSQAPTFDQAARQGATGEAWAVANHLLMTAEELGRYFARDDKLLRQLVLRNGYRPLILQRAFYDKHELFHERFDA